MEIYSPSQVTDDIYLEDADVNSEVKLFYADHDDRNVVEYIKPEFILKDNSLFRSRFSDEDIDGAEMENSFVTKSSQNLRIKVNAARKTQNQTYQKLPFSRKSSCEKSNSCYKPNSKYRSTSHKESKSPKRSKCERQSKSGRHDNCEYRYRSRSRDRHDKAHDHKYHKSSSSKSYFSRDCYDYQKKQIRKYSEKKSRYLKKDNLDIEIRIKNDSRTKRCNKSVDKDRDSSSHKLTSSLVTNSNRYTEQCDTLVDFKQCLEDKFKFSIDNIVKAILTTKSSSEIKEMLNVDISVVNASKEMKLSVPIKGKVLNPSLNGQCIHCLSLFKVSTPPGLCLKCHKPRDELSANLCLPVKSPKNSGNIGNHIARPSMVPGSQLPIFLPPVTVPLMPQLTSPVQFNYPRPFFPMKMPNGPMPQFPPVPGSSSVAAPESHCYPTSYSPNRAMDYTTCTPFSHLKYAPASNHVLPVDKTVFQLDTISSELNSTSTQETVPALSCPPGQPYLVNDSNISLSNYMYHHNQNVLPYIRGHTLLPATSVPSISEHSLILQNCHLLSTDNYNQDNVLSTESSTKSNAAAAQISAAVPIILRTDSESFGYQEDLDAKHLNSGVTSTLFSQKLRDPSDIIKTLVPRL